MIKLIDILKKDNWREILTSAPYCLKTDEKTMNGKDYILFKYNQIDSDLSNDVVKECRGIIIRKNDLKVVCYPFNKFFNYGETNAAKIDFNTAKVQEKVDGSIMKMWYDGEWFISTNGKIDAAEPTCTVGKNFKELFLESLQNHFNDIDKYNSFLQLLDNHIKEGKNYTYIFEMVHPLNRIVIQYDKPDVRHIGTRDNDTYKELNIDIGVKKPTDYHFNSIQDVVDMAHTLSYSEEGYVVVDANWNRVKVKSPAYLAVHHLKNNNVLSAKRVMEIIMKNEQEEVLSIFPEFTEYFNVATEKFNAFKNDVLNSISEVKKLEFSTKKEFALFVLKNRLSDFFFKVYDNRYTYDDLNLYLDNVGAEKIADLLKLKDELIKI